MHPGMCYEILDETRHSRHRGGEYSALSTRVSTGKDREPERVRMAQPGSRVSRWEPMAGRWRDGPRRAAASRINGLSCRRRCRREGEGKRESGMNYDGSVSQRQENVGRYILRNIPILWAAPAPSDERKGGRLPSPFRMRELPLCNVAVCCCNEYRWAKWGVVKTRAEIVDRLIVLLFIRKHPNEEGLRLLHTIIRLKLK